MNQPQMLDFLSPHTSAEQVVSIQVEPNLVYLEEGRKANLINFDFILKGLTDKKNSTQISAVMPWIPMTLSLIHNEKDAAWNNL